MHTQWIGQLPAPIEFIFNTPSHHRAHHGRNPRYIDKNYGGTLIVFDRLFGTFVPETEAPDYGLVRQVRQVARKSSPAIAPLAKPVSKMRHCGCWAQAAGRPQPAKKATSAVGCIGAGELLMPVSPRVGACGMKNGW